MPSLAVGESGLQVFGAASAETLDDEVYPSENLNTRPMIGSYSPQNLCVFVLINLHSCTGPLL